MPEGEESGKAEGFFTRPISNTTCESRVCNKTRSLIYVVQSVNAYHNIKIEAEKSLVIPNLINLDMLVLKPGECAMARVGSIVLGVEREWGVRVAECGVVDASPRGYRRVKCPSNNEVLRIIRMMDDEEWGVTMPYITAVAYALQRRLESVGGILSRIIGPDP
jgi:hypothetical protein